MTRHELDLFSLLSGLVLTGIGLIALFGVSLDVAAWMGPAILIGLGIVVLATTTGSSRSSGGEGDDADPERDETMAAAREEVARADHTAD